MNSDNEKSQKEVKAKSVKENKKREERIDNNSRRKEAIGAKRAISV